MKKDKTKNPLKTFKKVLVAGALCCTMAFGAVGLTGCSDGTDGKDGLNGKDGTQWYSGTTNIELVTTGNNGDFYYDTDDYKLYQKENGSWVLKVENFGKPGTNGTNGTNGQDGSSVFIGYDGYVWQDGLKTEFKIEKDATLTENVVEDTIGAYTTMKYFVGSYLDLTTNRIALMANYKPNAKLTQYSGTKVTEIQVVAESAGTLHIGTAKVADIVTARTNGTTYTATTTSYNVTAGVNTITFATPLEVGEDETIVLGGSGSTAKVYVANNIPVSDEQGNFTLVDSTTHTDVLAKTGNYADTLAVRVKVESASEVALFENLTTAYPASSIASNMFPVSDGSAPFKYKDNSKLSGKTITKIGVAVYSLESVASGTQPFMTVYKVKTSVKSNFASQDTAIKIYFPADTQANTWAYADCDINLADDETIVFGAQRDDTINWAYSKTVAGGLTDNNFTTNSGKDGDAVLLFDIYVKDASSWDTHLEKLEKAEQDAIETIKAQELKTILKGKNFSILGDSISTFNGYSNDSTNTNSTIGSNAIYYNGSSYGVTDVNETWWKQTADKTGMNVLVNNSHSGDKVTNLGQTRCEQLHDDTGTNAGTNPDIIAVYLGINDFDGGVSADTFKSSYDTMIGKIVAKYNNTENSTSADIYLFTLLPNNMKEDDTTLNAYNTAIREIAEKYGCTVVDLYTDSGITAENVSTYTGDSYYLHPNMAGMDKMTDCFWNALYENYVTNAD